VLEYHNQSGDRCGGSEQKRCFADILESLRDKFGASEEAYAFVAASNGYTEAARRLIENEAYEEDGSFSSVHATLAGSRGLFRFETDWVYGLPT